MKKVTRFVVLALVFALMLGMTAFAAEEISVQIDGKEVVFTDVKPVEKDGTVFIPLRAVFEAAGADVYWEGETQTIISSLGEDKVIMQVGNPVLFINSGTSYSMHPFVPYIENDRTFIPFTAFSMSFSYGYNENGNVISFTK